MTVDQPTTDQPTIQRTRVVIGELHSNDEDNFLKRSTVKQNLYLAH